MKQGEVCIVTLRLGELLLDGIRRRANVPWGKAHINLKRFIGHGEMDERATSVCSLQSLFDTPKNNSDRPSREA